MKKKISELPDGTPSLTKDDLLVVVEKDTDVTGNATIDAVVRIGTPIYLKANNNLSSREYLIENEKPPIDDVLVFNTTGDGIAEGFFEIQCSAFFRGSPPAAYVEFNSAGCHGFQKIFKVNFVERPEGVPSFTGSALGVGSAAVIDEIKSILVPNSTLYEPMFFYENDPELSEVISGYFLEVNAIAYLDAENPIRFRWCSAIDGLATTLESSSLQITRLIIK